MNILDRIVEQKRIEVEARRRNTGVGQLERFPAFMRTTVSLSAAVGDPSGTGIIAEFKRRSPSKGMIHANASVTEITSGYVKAGAAALSVLTDEEFFGGTMDDLMAARKANGVPILRKDFTIDEYQIVEARAIGADAILLIAAVLRPEQSRAFARLAHSLGLEVLLEVHDEQELKANLDAGADLIGVNNRNLKDFSVSIETSMRLSAMIPEGVVKVSESGISQPDTIASLRNTGYQGFLIGENFMKEADPAAAATAFIGALKGLGKMPKPA